jgi:hypothetical protein
MVVAQFVDTGGIVGHHCLFSHVFSVLMFPGAIFVK